MTTLYVGNLPFSATESEVRGLFEQHGTVLSVNIINDRETGRPRGFCFVEMATDDAQPVIANLNGFAMNGTPVARQRGARARVAAAPRCPAGGRRALVTARCSAASCRKFR